MLRWKRNLLILWTTQVISLMSFGFGFPFIPLYMEELGVSDPATLKLLTGLLSMAPAVTMAIMAPIWGTLSDRYGRKLMIIRAMTASSIIIGLMGFVSAPWQLLVLRLCQGLFTGTVTAATAFIASNTPENKLSSALGIMSSSTFIGFSIGPMLGGYFAEWFGYRVSFYAGGLLMLVGVALVVFLLKEDLSTLPGKTKKNKPKNQKKIFTSLILSLLGLLFFLRLSRSIFPPYLSLFVKETVGKEDGVAAIVGNISGLVGFITALSAMVVGKLADRMNKQKLLFALLSSGTIVGLGLMMTNSLSSFIVMYACLYLCLGGVEPIIMSITAQNTAPEQRGKLFGFQGMVGSAGWIAATGIGTFVSIKFSISTLFVLIPILLSISVLFVMKIMRSQKRKRLTTN